MRLTRTRFLSHFANPRMPFTHPSTVNPQPHMDTHTLRSLLLPLPDRLRKISFRHTSLISSSRHMPREVSSPASGLHNEIASRVATRSLRQGIGQKEIPPPTAVVSGNSIRVSTAQKVLVPPAKSLPQASKPSNPHPPAPNPHPAPANPSEDHSVYTPETYQDWIANVTLEKYALGGTGRVEFFIGPREQIPADPADWPLSPIYVGSYTIFARNITETGCGNCKDQAERHVRVGGTVHLTKAMIRNHCPLVGDEPVQYLTENLHWRCSNSKGEEIPRENVPSLKVVVQSAGYEIPPGGLGTRPVRGPWTRHSAITRGKPGGVNHGNEF